MALQNFVIYCLGKATKIYSLLGPEIYQSNKKCNRITDRWMHRWTDNPKITMPLAKVSGGIIWMDRPNEGQAM